MAVKPKRFDPRSRWVRYRDGMWIPTRKRIYLYWFKFLQHAEKDESKNVDWKKYSGWGGSNYILGTKFDMFWEDNWKKLFGVKDVYDEPKFPLSTEKPKPDGYRYSLLVYENRHRGSNWEIAKWISKREVSKRGAGLTSSSLFYSREDMEGEYSVEDKMIIQSRIGRYKNSTDRYLNSVCNGMFSIMSYYCNKCEYPYSIYITIIKY